MSSLLAAVAAATALTQRLAFNFVGIGANVARPRGVTAMPVNPGQSSATAMRVGERAAHIAIVEVDVKPGDEDAFLEASLANARESTREESNQRFDVLQNQKDPTKFALVEIYRGEQGPIQHKATPHYATWRETVADMMASPRSATQYDTIFPGTASGYNAVALILERDIGVFFDITHVYVDVLPGQEEAFIDATIENAKGSLREDENMRFDIMQSVEDPTKFLLVEVFRSSEGAFAHKGTPHYETWRDTVAGMMASPRQAKKYVNQYPNLPAGWQSDGDPLQAGGKNWAR
eukprot:CAMPEP_0195089582 /NCGR_PEP_ID=MMETSP0448-20130528/28826_1 /TAXON_ID=66468 /ORGANISM="Heterocapsa triquestra, Strain CCMP 448" /LENGTH=290 /DNA_ID=CAMNT_0040123317 /DNA_START=1 /DNA_END=873 /DNA_ORIENTATION=+